MAAGQQKQKGRAHGMAVPCAPMQEKGPPTQQETCATPILPNIQIISKYENGNVHDKRMKVYPTEGTKQGFLKSEDLL